MGTNVKGPHDYLRLGDWNFICAYCGRKGKGSEAVKLPAGIPGGSLYVHPEHYIARNPQDLVRGVPDIQVPPWVQPPGQNEFTPFCTPNGLSAVPGEAEPGCVTPGYLSPAYNPDGD